MIGEELGREIKMMLRIIGRLQGYGKIQLYFKYL